MNRNLICSQFLGCEISMILGCFLWLFELRPQCYFPSNNDILNIVSKQITKTKNSFTSTNSAARNSCHSIAGLLSHSFQRFLTQQQTGHGSGLKHALWGHMARAGILTPLITTVSAQTSGGVLRVASVNDICGHTPQDSLHSRALVYVCTPFCLTWLWPPEVKPLLPSKESLLYRNAHSRAW